MRILFTIGTVVIGLVSTFFLPFSAESNAQSQNNKKGVFVAVGYGGRRMKSTDGKTWKITAEWAQPGKDDKNNLMGLVHAEGKFVAVGGGGGGKTGGGHILVSLDGVKWKHVYEAKNRINPIIYGKGRFVVGGPRRQLLWSEDGEKWNLGAKIEEKVATHFRHGVFGNGVFVLVGNHGGGGPPYWCAVSPDGESISHVRTDMPSIRSIAFGAGRFVIVGEGGVRISSTDGKSWHKHHADKSENFRWVLWTGKTFLAGGGKNVYSSGNGQEWGLTKLTFRGSPKWTDGQRFISTSWPGRMYFSADGKMWEKSPPLTANGINKVVFGVLP